LASRCHDLEVAVIGGAEPYPAAAEMLDAGFDEGLVEWSSEPKAPYLRPQILSGLPPSGVIECQKKS
jgi:hypothetical protein